MCTRGSDALRKNLMSQAPPELKLVPIIALTIGLGLLLVFLEPPKKTVIDCSMAEFHPDITLKMKEQCRESRQQQKKAPSHEPRTTSI